MANQKIFSELYMTWSGSTIGYATDFKYNFKSDTIEITSAQSVGGWKEYLPGLTDWDASCSGMYVRSGGTYKTPDDFIANFVSGNTPVTLVFTSQVTNDKIWSGSAIVTDIAADTKVGSNVTYSVTFKGTGPVTVTTK